MAGKSQPTSSLSSTTKKKRKRWERTSTDDDYDDDGGGRYVSSSALAWEWSLQNVVLGVVLFFCSCCQGGRGGEREGGDWRLRRCARLLVQQNNF